MQRNKSPCAAAHGKATSHMLPTFDPFLTMGICDFGTTYGLKEEFERTISSLFCTVTTAGWLDGRIFSAVAVFSMRVSLGAT